jgi:hypothetical protein
MNCVSFRRCDSPDCIDRTELESRNVELFPYRSLLFAMHRNISPTQIVVSFGLALYAMQFHIQFLPDFMSSLQKEGYRL